MWNRGGNEREQKTTEKDAGSVKRTQEQEKEKEKGGHRDSGTGPWLHDHL